MIRSTFMVIIFHKIGLFVDLSLDKESSGWERVMLEHRDRTGPQGEGSG